MYFKKIRLKDFRNFSDQTFKFSSGINFLVGENGQGKSNLLEALTLFTQGESFRYGDNSSLIKENAEESLVTTEVENLNLEYELKLSILKSRRHFLINEKKISALDLKKKFNSVIFSPESLSTIKESSDLRRHLVDDLLVSISSQNAELIYDFRKALKTRNRILKDFVEKLQSQETTERLLESLDPSYFRLAAELTKARILALKEIQSEFNNAMQYISKNKTVDISVEYLVSDENIMDFLPQKIIDSMQNRSEELRSAEMASGGTLVGPHKHQILFLYGQKDSRFYCSQGQQRAIILSFKMAQVVYHRRVHGEYPVLLLDDVLSELDSTKKEALILFLHEIKTQTFITTTDLTLPESFHVEQTAVISIRDGKIQE
ncbi:MAG: DNA replication and repair protein RecF [Bdellovibrionota bacterium]